MTRRAVGWLVLASCGSSSGGVTDAAPADTAIDGAIDAALDASPDAPSNTVVVITKGFGDRRLPDTLAPNIAIVSHRVDGSVLATATSNAQGVASIEVAPGGAVSAIYPQLEPPTTLAADLVTFVGVVAGDVLVFQSFDRLRPVDTGWSGAQVVDWPALPGAAQYNIASSCGTSGMPGASTSGTRQESEACHVEPMDLLLWATLGDFNATVLGCGSFQNAPFSETTPLTLASWQAPVTANLAINDILSPIDDVTAVFATVIDDAAHGFLRSKFGAPQGSSHTASFPWCTFGDRIDAYAVLSRPDVRGRMEYHEALPTTQTSWTASVFELPPWIESTSLAANAATGAVSWTLVPSAMVVADAVTVTLEFPQQVAGPNTGTWQLVLPPSTTSLTLPALPSALAPYAPAPTSTITVRSVQTFDANVPDYAAVRALGAGVALCPGCALRRGLVTKAAISTGYLGFSFPGM